MNQVQPLDRVKLCIIGDPEVGKSCLRTSLQRTFLQAALLPEPRVEGEEREESAGIQIEEGVRIGNSTYAVWDFAGQLESYITHQLFMTTNSTVYVAIVNLLSPLDDMRAQLTKWLRMIKVRNVGLLRYVPDPVHSKQDIKTLRQPEIVEDTLDQNRAGTFSIAGRACVDMIRVCVWRGEGGVKCYEHYIAVRCPHCMLHAPLQLLYYTQTKKWQLEDSYLVI